MSRDKPAMVTFLKAHPENFDVAMKLALSQEQPISWRATWMIGGSVKKYDSQIQPYIQNILDILPDLEDGHQREFLKVLNQLELVEEHEGQLLDFSISVWEQLKKQPSVRHTAFRIMVKAAKKYPELANEVLLLTQPQYINTLSPGVKKGVFKMLEELRKYKGENN
tara:strand:+ start:65050 stop:65547 length:498 start_codon:yes stop_codon:yes gene_type:complete